MTRLHANARRWRTVVALALIPILLSNTGCAVLFRGSRQTIPFDSNPPGAEIYLDGNLVGVTPTTVKFSRARNHVLLVRSENWEREILLTHSIDPEGGWLLFVDVVPGGGLAIASAAQGCGGGGGMFDFSGLCRGFRGIGIGFGLTTAGIPLVIDLATGAYYELSPGEVFVDTEAIIITPTDVRGNSVEGFEAERDETNIAWVRREEESQPTPTLESRSMVLWTYADRAFTMTGTCTAGDGEFGFELIYDIDAPQGWSLVEATESYDSGTDTSTLEARTISDSDVPWVFDPAPPTLPSAITWSRR